MTVGIVKWFNQDKGYGFIRSEEGSEDTFVHITDVQRSGLATLKQGERLEYDLYRDMRRNKTSAVNLISLTAH